MDKIYILRVNGQDVYLGEITKTSAKRIKREFEKAGVLVDLIEFTRL